MRRLSQRNNSPVQNQSQTAILYCSYQCVISVDVHVDDLLFFRCKNKRGKNNCKSSTKQNTKSEPVYAETRYDFKICNSVEVLVIM